MTTFLPTMSSTTTTNAWQRPLAYTTTALSSQQHSRSGWVALEKTPKEKDTEKLIQKANDHATLLLELLNLGEKPSSMQELKNNEVVQQVYTACQDYSAELVQRIASEVEDDFSSTTTFDYSSFGTSAQSSSSSSANPFPNNTTTPTKKEIQTENMLAAIERLQLAFKEYDELQDFLHAKHLQTVEEYYAEDATITPASSPWAISRIVASANAEDNDGEEENDEAEAWPRSQQPIEYKLDPRPDYRANQRRLKNGKVTSERMEAKMERAREKLTVDPTKIMTASLKIEEEEEKTTEEENKPTTNAVATQSQQASDEAVVDEVAMVKDTGYLSDSSWEEVAEDEDGRTSLVVDDEVDSGSSSIVVVGDGATRLQ